MKSKRVAGLVAVSLIVASMLLPARLSAQNIYASLTGTVTDAPSSGLDGSKR